MTIRCAIYARTATEAGSNSVDAQRERAATYIESRRSEGWEIHPRRYDDRACSGLSMNRPALRRLLREATDGEFEMVIACDIDRLSRSPAGLLAIVEILEGAGVSLATVTEELNTSTPRGRMILNLLLNPCRHSLRTSS